MSDLISREALLKQLKHEGTYLIPDGASESEFIYYSDAVDLITNAPVVSGEAVARFVSKRSTPEGTQEFFGLMLTDPIEPLSLLYATPQQPQSVADALEEAANLCVEISAEHNDPFQSMRCANAIRALIKRNAKGVE